VPTVDEPELAGKMFGSELNINLKGRIMPAKQSSSKTAKTNEKPNVNGNPELLTPRQWNDVSRRLIDFSAQLPISKSGSIKVNAAKSAKA